jgi:hypothetical protein
VSAFACQFRQFCHIVTIFTAIFLVIVRDAVAGGMVTLIFIRHKFLQYQ